MKKDIHPQWYNEAQITCACGNTFTTGSTHESLQVEICAKCHPFFTGEMKFVDTQGRVEKFTQKRQKSEARRQELAKKAAEKSQRNAANDQSGTGEVQSYRQILAATQNQMKKSKKEAKKTTANKETVVSN